MHFGKTEMFLRFVGTYVAVARHLSTAATAAQKAPQTSSSSSAAAAASSAGGRDTLGRRLLSLVFPKRSAVIAINKWKEEGHPSPRKYELNRIVRELRKSKRYKHALEVALLFDSLLLLLHKTCNNK